MSKAATGQNLPDHILARISEKEPFGVWTANDFADLGTRSAVDVALSRLQTKGDIRRIDRGLYDSPKINSLTKKPTSPSPHEIIDAVARRDGLRYIIDGMTAANDLGLDTAVPAKIIVYTDARLRDIKLGKLEITFKAISGSKLFWAGRPAMRLVQALNYLQDKISRDRDIILARIHRLLADPEHGENLSNDLKDGFRVLPPWMQDLLRPHVFDRTADSAESDEPSFPRAGP